MQRPAVATATARLSTGPPSGTSTDSSNKFVWLSTTSQDTLTAALEAGIRTVVFDVSSAAQAAEWQQLGRFDAITRGSDGRLRDASGAQVGRVRTLASPEDLRAAEREAGAADGVVVMDASDWQIIPAENLVAAYQHNPRATLMAAAPDCASSRVMLEALEAGTDGVLLRTDSPAEVRELAQYLREREQQGAARLRFDTATVTSVRPVGMGDRACVDLCSLLEPGEGLLVGSFARAMFLVASECAESKYIASRPFRVNAGPVHAYVQLPGGKTGYLSELESGSEVLVAAAGGGTRTALVGRVKIESRPLVLVEAELPGGDRCSALLQNAETVRVVGPAAAGGGGASGSGHASSSGAGNVRAALKQAASRASAAKAAMAAMAAPNPAADAEAAAVAAVAVAAAAIEAADAAEHGYVWQQGCDSNSGSGSGSGRSKDGAAGAAGAAAAAAAGAVSGWHAVSVSQLMPGDQMFVLRQEGARHTGVAIQESISER